MPETIFINDDGFIESTPTYLFDYSDLYKAEPIEAGLHWFAEAHYGLSVGFGLFSLIGHGYDTMVKDNFSHELYSALKEKFTAEHFDTMDLVEFVIANGMRYLDFNVCAPDGFCLWNTSVSPYNSFNSPAKRDLLAEVASVCEYHGIGLCLTYSHGKNWQHPHSPQSRATVPEGGANLQIYKEYVAAQIHELLTQYGPIAAICLDGLDSARTVGPDDFECLDLYNMIHSLQPQTLVSYQQGFTGEEDFFTIEETLPDNDAPAEVQGFVNQQMHKPVQVRTSLTPGFLGYNPELAGKHLKTEDVWKLLQKAGSSHYNFLPHACLMPDGSIDLEDMNTLLEVGKRIEKNGYP